MAQNSLNRYRELARKWLNGTITPEEAQEYANWYNRDTDIPLEVPFSFAENKEQQERRILQAIRQQITPVVSIRTHVVRMTSVAAILLLIFVGVYFYFRPLQPAFVEAKIPNPNFKNDILPGTNKAVLTLANGETIVLDSAATGKLAVQGNTNIVNENGALSYTATGGNAVLLYNTLTTQKGEQYPLTLADGTKVWLNAASSIHFPVAFTGNERRVEITGEAYFEVMPLTAEGGQGKTPFIVKINRASGSSGEVEVLGTHFNVNAYDNEDAVKTTLLEGAVAVNRTTMLKPGQQSQFYSDGAIKVIDDADTEAAVAWKNGQFHFSQVDIAAIMRQAERWYDIEVVYEGHKTTDRFTGDIPRTANLTELLTILQYARVHFRLEGKKLIVLP